MRRFFRHRPSPALVISLIALSVALGGTGYAAISLKRNSVGNKQLKKNAVTTEKVKNFTLLKRDFKRGQLPAGAQGPKGDTGATGSTGSTGPAGPAEGPAGGALTGSYPNPGLAAGIVAPSNFATIPSVRVRRTIDQSIADNTNTTIQFNSEAFDTAAMHDNTTNNTRLTAPIAGKYLVTGNVTWAASVADRRLIEFSKTSGITTTVVAQNAVHPVQIASIPTVQGLTTVIDMAAGDYVELAVFQKTGGALNVAASNEQPNFTLSWIGP
jgi:hypothetical protein